MCQGYTACMADAIIASLLACSTTRMDSTNPLNLTRNAKLLLAAAGLLLWGIGGTIDGASLRSPHLDHRPLGSAGLSINQLK